jgi:bla regulator protein BlaR1
MNWLDLVVGNALGATVIALFVFGLGARLRRPTVLHALWGLVLLKLVSVPVLEPEVLPAREKILSALAVLPASPAASSLPTAPSSLPKAASVATRPGGQGRSRELAAPRPLERDEPGLTGPRSGAGSFGGNVASLLRTGALLGTLVVLVLTVVRGLRFSRLLRTAPLAPPEFQERAEQLSRAFGLSRAPRLRLVPGRVPPSVWPRPGGCEILLPASLLPSLAAAERDLLLAHELAHVRRRDHWLRPLELVVVALWWWFPVAWWARRRFRAAEEKACDALVLSRLPHAARSYADGLIKTLEFLAHPSQSTPALATGAVRVSLQERVTMILDKNTRSPLPRRLVPLVVAAGLLALLTSPGWLDTTAARAKEDADAEIERTHAARMLEFEHQRLELEQARHQLELQRWEVELRHQEESQAREFADVRAEIERLRSEGLAAEAESRERELASREREASVHRKWLEFERGHAAEVAAVEMELRKTELEQQEAELRGAGERRHENEERLLELQRKLKTLEIQKMRAELEQLREMIELREQELETERSAK